MNNFGPIELKIHHKQAWENFKKDKILTHTQKKAFIDHLKSYNNPTTATTSPTIEEHCKEFFRKKDERGKLINKLKGLSPSPTTNLNGEVLGRLTPKDTFIGLLREANDGSPSGLGARRLRAVIEDLFGSSSGGRQRALREIQLLYGGKKLGEYITWSFRNDFNPHEPFNGKVKKNDYPCALGLDELYVSYAGYSYKSSGLSVRSPTFFDAELREKWRPTGKTLPLCETDALLKCKNEYSSGVGFTEVVHEPVTINEIFMPLELIKYDRTTTQI